MWRSKGNADERPNSQHEEAEGQPSTVGAASGGWAGGETARSVGDHRVEQDHDLASGAGRVVSSTVPFGRRTHPGGGLAGTGHLRLDRWSVPRSVTTHPTPKLSWSRSDSGSIPPGSASGRPATHTSRHGHASAQLSLGVVDRAGRQLWWWFLLGGWSTEGGWSSGVVVMVGDGGGVGWTTKRS